MSDLTIVLNATGNLDSQVAKAVAQIQLAAQEAKKPGKEFGDGFAGAVKRLQHFSQEMNKYLAAGAGVYRIAQAGIDTWASMHEHAAARINKANKEVFESQRKIYEGEVKQRAKSWENTQLSTVLRMSGVDSDSRGAEIMGSLQSLSGPIGEQIRTQLFPKIAQQIASQRLSATDTTDALQRAATGLNQYGHVPGYGDAYADLAGTKGMAGRENLSDMALALSLRRARLSEGESTRLTEGMRSGSIRVGDDGELRGDSGMADLVKLVNGMGGLALRAGTEAWRPTADQVRAGLGGMSTVASPGEGAQFRLPDGLRGPLPVAPKLPEQVDKDSVGLSDISFTDVVKSMATLAQQAGAAAIAIGFMTVAARLNASGAAGKAAAAAAGAAAGGGGAVATGAGGTLLAGAGVLAARVGGFAARTGGALATGLAGLTVNPEILNSWTIWGQRQPQADPKQAIANGGDYLDAIAKAASETNAILREQTSLMRQSGLVPAQAGE